MKILLTGVTGYIGKRLLPKLLEDGHEVVCVMRDISRMDLNEFMDARVELVEADFLEPDSLRVLPKDVDVAYYLIHSMSAEIEDFSDLEKRCAENFKGYAELTALKQVIYLSGIVNEEELSTHLLSRKGVEEILSSDKYALTTLRAGIIVGSGSASFEIIRDLVDKLPIMITPKWVNTRSQPIAITDVLQYLTGVLLFEKAFNRSFDIGGPEVLTYKEMMTIAGKVRGLQPVILTVPVMTPKLSSYWLFFVTSTSYKLAVNLVESMKVEIICRDNPLQKWLNIRPITYKEAVNRALVREQHQQIASRWTDALSGDLIHERIRDLQKVPVTGILKDVRKQVVTDTNEVLERIWSIGGATGWYYANTLWAIRGLIDKMVGGVGLRRGRKHPTAIQAGETLDFWRVIHASKTEKHLLLYAEMRLPGQAWLEFKISGDTLLQRATFRPKGVFGRMYWYLLQPVHNIIFSGMIRRIAA